MWSVVRSLFSVGIIIVALGPDAAEGAGKRMALLVGCEKYEHAELPELEFAEEDVHDLGQVLKAQGCTTVILTARAGKGDKKLIPTAGNIRAALDRLVAKGGSEDQVLLAFVGHGLQPVGANQPFFCPVDADPSVKSATAGSTDQAPVSPESLIGIGDVLQRISEAGISSKWVLLDACRHEGLFNGPYHTYLGFKEMPPKSAMLVSCQAGEIATESKALKHGLFMFSVLEGMKGGAADGRGTVTFYELFNYVNKRTSELAVSLQTRQKPHGAWRDAADKLEIGKVKPGVTFKPPTVAALKLEANKGPVAKAPKAAKGAGRQDAGDRSVINIGEIEVPFRWCPPGSFLMGSPPAEKDRLNFEDHVKVTLSRGFWLAETEVTQQLYESVTGMNPVSYQRGPRKPVIEVSWDNAIAFCKELTKRERAAGRLSTTGSFRLPTEAEWEYACRAGTTTATAFGATLSGKQANFDSNFPYGDVAQSPPSEKVSEVGKYPANAWGLFDMHGNASEWCEDDFVEKLKGGTDPKGFSGINSRVNRGGSFGVPGKFLRSAMRSFANQDRALPQGGFRIVRDD